MAGVDVPGCGAPTFLGQDRAIEIAHNEEMREMTKEQRKLVRVTIEERRMVANRTGRAYVTIPESTPSEIIEGVVRQMMEDQKITWTDCSSDDFFTTREMEVHHVDSVPAEVTVLHYSFGPKEECHCHLDETGKEVGP